MTFLCFYGAFRIKFYNLILILHKNVACFSLKGRISFFLTFFFSFMVFLDTLINVLFTSLFIHLLFFSRTQLFVHVNIIIKRKFSGENSIYKSWHLPHGPTELLVGHPGILFSVAPHFGYPVRLHELEDAVLRPFPTDQARVCGRIQKEITDEFPEFAITFA